MAEYVVNLNPNFDDLEDFEEENNNLCRVIILDRKHGKKFKILQIIEYNCN